MTGVLETEDQVIFGEYLEYKLDRRDELDRQIEALALEPAYREAVGRLCCLQGISTQAAMVLVTEIGDFRRFGHPGKLMAYLGLVPRELAGFVWALMQESVAEIEAGRRAA